MTEIPLFPLPLVMFPGVLTPLHIFEERYRLLINRCIDEASVFGIVLLPPGTSKESEETIRRVGVTVRVAEFQRLDDGRLNIAVAGERRFQILEFTGNDPYWTARVEFMDADESGEELQESCDTVARLYRYVHTLASEIRGKPTEAVKTPESPAALSHMVSYVLAIDAEAKQELLEMSSVTGRLKTLTIHLEELRQRLSAQLVRVRIRKVTGNGNYGLPN